MSTHHTDPAVLTTERTIALGDVLSEGLQGVYRGLVRGAGEPHTVRDDLLPDAEQVWRTAPRRPVLALTHITDLQLADVHSPARFEFFNREFTDPRFQLLVPTQRPNEALTVHAVEATIATLNRITSAPVGGGPLALAVATGDAIDNGQWNELLAVLALFEGGEVSLAPPTSGPVRYEGVQRPDWPDRVFWQPDGEGVLGPDMFAAGYGYPRHPGVLDRALHAFTAGGLGMPWLTCYGNHEGLIQGVGRMTPELAAAMVAGSKPLALPDDLDRDTAYETFVAGAHTFLKGAQRDITPDPRRRPVSRAEFVQAHFRPGARPVGHGFGERNRRDGTAYYSYDVAAPAAPGGAIRFIALDTTCLLGGADGAIDAEQLAWLEGQLREVHSRHLGTDGEPVTSTGDDRYVVLFSHHGLDTLSNHRCSGAFDGTGYVAAGPDGAAVPVVPAADVLALVHRYPNVVAWINGHTHTNGVRARLSPHRLPDGGRGGFWEITTCAIVDWPCQTRIVELIDISDGGRGQLALACTMVDHDSPLAPGGAFSRRELAALHRELAANIPMPGYGERLAGAPSDRNVVLPLRVGG